MTLALLLTVTTGAWADELSESFTTNTSAAVYTGEHFKITVGDVGSGKGFYLAENKYATIEALNGEIITKVELTKGYYYINNFYCEVGTTNISGDVATVSGVNNTSLTFTALGALQIKAVKVYYTAPEPDVEVTTNAAEEGATFTEASFAMPAFDATAEYVIVRDMAQQMTTKVGDGEEGFNIVVKKNEQGEGYVPAEMTPQAMAGLITVTDDMEEKDLTIMTDYTVEIFAADTDGKPTGDAIAFADLTPGTYVAVATGIDLYDGTAVSNTFALVEECDLTLSPAQSDKVESITVDGTAVTPDENGVIKKIKPGKKVVLKVNSPDYIIRKATLKKTVASANTITIGDITLDVEGCETWQNVIEKNSEKISSFASFAIKDNSYSDNQSGMKVLKLGDDFVVPSNPLDLSKTYTWTVIVPE
jgi:hypothetical protein